MKIKHIPSELYFVAFIVAWGISALFFNYRASVCADNGYPEHQFKGFTSYCVKRVNQTDEIVRYSEVKTK